MAQAYNVVMDGRFFDGLRADLFNGHMTGSQVTGIQLIVQAWTDKHATEDVRQLAYCLATAYHETAKTMQPIEEYGKGRGHAYGIPDPVTKQTYYGRGYVQLTWATNYRKLGTVLTLDLLNHPDIALVPTAASLIMFEGMRSGFFTGKRLSDYFNNTTEDPFNARRIINGLDRAQDIADYYGAFLDAVVPPTPSA